MATYNLAGKSIVPEVDFSGLGNLGKIYKEAQQEKLLSDLGPMIASGNIDYDAVAGKLASAGKLDTALAVMKLGQERKALVEFNRPPVEPAEPTRPTPGPIGPMAGLPPPAAAPPSVVPKPPSAMDQRWAPVTEAIQQGVFDPQGKNYVSAGGIPTAAPNVPPPPVAPQPAPAQPERAEPPLRSRNEMYGKAQEWFRKASIPGLPKAQVDEAKAIGIELLKQTGISDPEKKYAAYHDQETRAGRAPKSLENFLISIAKAGAQPEAEKAEEKGVGEGAAKRYNAVVDAAAKAPQALANLSRISAIVDAVKQGKVEPARMTISAWAKSLGLNDDIAKGLGLDPAKVGDAQALQALSAETLVGKIGSGGFPANNFSDADRAFLERTVPQLANDPRANKIIVEVARRAAQKEIEKGREAVAWRRANKGKGYDEFEAEWAEKVRQKDVLGDLRREADALLGGAQPAGVNALPPPSLEGVSPELLRQELERRKRQ